MPLAASSQPCMKTNTPSRTSLVIRSGVIWPITIKKTAVSSLKSPWLQLSLAAAFPRVNSTFHTTTTRQRLFMENVVVDMFNVIMESKLVGLSANVRSANCVVSLV